MSVSKNGDAPKDGIYNLGGLASAAIGPVFIAAVPVTSWITQPGGLLESAVHGFVNSVAYIASAGSVSSIPAAGTIPALSALYMAFTFALTGSASVAGVAAGRPGGRNNKEPRTGEQDLRGLPLRLKSAHMNLMENFPGFALSAALAATMAPSDQQVANLLGLHVMSKVLVFYPAYLAGVDQVRSGSHLVATAAVINVAWRLAMVAK